MSIAVTALRAPMKLGMVIDYAGGFGETVELIVAYEQAGLEMIAIPEAYSFDAVSQLGYIAARTERLELMSAIMPIYSRTPSLTAMSAAGLDYVSDGRFTLGLGASGPQVVEGFHGVRYDAPLGRMREVIEICRQVWSRRPVAFRGDHYVMPLTAADGGSGLGKPLRLINRPVRADIPISVAALGLKNVAMVAELAQGWQPLFFDPRRATDIWGDALAEGFSRRDPELGPLEIQLQVSFHFGEPSPEALRATRDQLALYIGGMGARGRNFYNQLACRYGYEPEATAIQELYLTGRKTEAAAAVPQELVDGVTLIGDEHEIHRRLEAFSQAGVTTLLLNPIASSAPERLDQFDRLAATLAALRDGCSTPGGPSAR
ncbi:LLM class F420-dependent oxidoreductase [Nocardioides sp. L-11A]|uniref:LLM class F420-dependent oxidoreductase n=1 Tax=Nocardioides sp. L-11A TaxID=3043848 RepID=UPI00249CCEEE|nr:LLM class F420-dependent oxidoreductase [Nocardioides sp. L-11A]